MRVIAVASRKGGVGFGSTLILLGDGKREAGHGDRSSGGYDDRSASSPAGGRPGSMSNHWMPPANGGGHGSPPKNDLDDEFRSEQTRN